MDLEVRMDFEVWIFDGRVPELLCRAPSLPAARARWSHSRHAAIFDPAGEVVDAKRESDPKRLAAIEAARAGRVVPVKTARPLPRAAATESMPARPSEPPTAPVETATAPDEEVGLTAPKPAKATRPATTRPPLPRRHASAVEVSAPTALPAVAPAAPAAPAATVAPSWAADDEAPALGLVSNASLARYRAERDEARALLSLALALGSEECARLRERATQLDAEVVLEGDRALRAEAEVEHLSHRTADDYQRGLAAGRAEVDAAARHAGELSRQLGAARDELEAVRIEVTSLRARPEPVSAPALDEFELARLIELAAALAARKAVGATREDLRLRAIAERVGGVERLSRLVSKVEELLGGWQS